MRQDQYERLQKLEEDLTEVFLDEADPAVWPGAGKPSAKLSQHDRKERYLYKRAATETAQLLVRTQILIGQMQSLGATPSDVPVPPAEQAENAAFERELVGAERDADRMRSALIERARKKARDG